MARMAVFKKNLEKVRSHNAVSAGYTLGVNKFADLSEEEWEKMQGFKSSKLGASNNKASINGNYYEDDDDDYYGFDDEPSNNAT